jgi:ribosomal protein L40E
MIVCPNCNHQNPEGALQCEACYTPLPSMASCPNCGASIQSDATFCGQCGYNLRPINLSNDLPPLVPPTFAVNSPPLPESANFANFEEETPPAEIALNKQPLESVPSNPPEVPATISALENDPLASLGVEKNQPVISEPVEPKSAPVVPPMPPAPPSLETKPMTNNTSNFGSATQLQTQKAKLLHVQTNTDIELPQNLSVIHIGKQNNQIPPDIDVSGFPNSEIVSRIHADIRIEGDTYFLEDVGSSNGTYINHTPLLAGDRHRLRHGDRVGLGKGDKMTFIFQITS